MYLSQGHVVKHASMDTNVFDLQEIKKCGAVFMFLHFYTLISAAGFVIFLSFINIINGNILKYVAVTAKHFFNENCA